MRKKLLGLIGIGTAAVLMLSGFDSAMTAGDLNAKAAEAVKAVEQCSGQIHAGADINMSVTQAVENGATMSVPVQGSMDGNFAITKEPFAASMDLQIAFSAMGETGDASMEIYAVENEDGTGSGYVHTVSDGTDSGWQASSIPAEDMAKIKEAMDKVSEGDFDTFLDEYTTEDSDLSADQIKELLSKWKETFEGALQLSPEPVDVNGRECYEESLDITGDLLTGAISDAAEVAGQALDASALAIVEMVAGALNIRVSSDYDAETYLPVAGAVDLTGSDFSMIAQIVADMIGGDEIGSVDLAVNELGAQYQVSYDDFGGVVIPDEALNAEVVDASSALSALGSALGGDTDIADAGDSTDLTDEVVINEDGSYHIEDKNYNDEVAAADITALEGMTLTYGTESYLSFIDDSYHKNVTYRAEAYQSAQDAIQSNVDVSYMENDEDYSDINVSDQMSLTLENGNTATYVTVSYKYDDYLMGGTYVVIPTGDHAILMELHFDDENYNYYDASEEDVIEFANQIALAG